MEETKLMLADGRVGEKCQSCTSCKKQRIHLWKLDELATWIGEQCGGVERMKDNVCKVNTSITKSMTFNTK